MEGQGALHHPGYSGVTLALMHGACPRGLVLCHHQGRDRIRVSEDREGGPRIPALAELRLAYEAAASWVNPASVVAASLNTLGLDAAAARSACEAAERELGVPVTDPVRFGAVPLAEAIESFVDRGRRGPGSEARARREQAAPKSGAGADRETREGACG